MHTGAVDCRLAFDATDATAGLPQTTTRPEELRAKVLQDHTICADDVELIRAEIERDGCLNLDDMKLLVELLSDANEVCPEFDELFFPALRTIVLRDGRIGQDEQFLLLKMLYSDGHVRDSEREFLVQLRREARLVPPEDRTRSRGRRHATTFDTRTRWRPNSTRRSSASSSSTARPTP